MKILFTFICIIAILLQGCASTSKSAVISKLEATAKTVLTQTAIATLQNIVNQQIAQGNIDYVHAAADALWKVGANPSNVEQIITDIIGDQNAEFAKQISTIAIKSGGNKTAILNAVASAISSQALSHD